MIRITRQSKKDELWSEVERLRRAVDQDRTRLAVIESEALRLRGENERLREKARFVEELTARAKAANEKLEILTSLTKELASFDVDGVLEVCVQRIPYLVGARCASVYLHDRARATLTLKHHTHGREIDRVVPIGPESSSLMAVAVRSREVLCIDDVGDFRPVAAGELARPYQENYRTASCVVAPLIAAGEVEGVLNLADRFDERPFDPGEHLGLIRQACELLAVSLRNARLFDEVTRAARTDSLTGLRNRQAFSEDLEVEVKRALRYENPLAVLACKVSGVRLINANYGHQAGDQVLARVGRLLVGNVRDVDLVGRTGGAEFGIILPEQRVEGALVVARRLSKLLSEARFEVGDARCALQVTFGIGDYRREGTGEDLLQRALTLLGRARDIGEAIGWERGEAP